VKRGGTLSQIPSRINNTDMQREKGNNDIIKATPPISERWVVIQAASRNWPVAPFSFGCVFDGMKEHGGKA
jgi:hypothetical protein